MPVPPLRRLIGLPGLDAAAAIPALTAALGGPFDVSAAAWRPRGGALIRLEGLEGSVGIRAAALRDRLAGHGEIIEAEDDALLLRCTNTQNPDTDLWRIVCRPGEAPGLLAALPVPVALDWGGALIHVVLPRDELPRLPRFSGHARRISGAAAMVLPAPDPVIRRLDAGLMRKFDPRGIFSGAD